MTKWDEYYLNVCKAVGGNSKCLSRHIGAILVMDKSIVSTGYNGPPRGVPPCNKRYSEDEMMQVQLKKMKKDLEALRINTDLCPRYAMDFKSGEGLEWCVAGHAERNSLINAARNGICTKGTIMYMDCGVPCTPCLVEIINAGVEEIVTTSLSYYDISGPWLVNQSQLRVRTFDGDVLSKPESEIDF